MKMQLDNKISAGDFARDLAAIGYVIYPNGTITRRSNVLPYRRAERECQERLVDLLNDMIDAGHDVINGGLIKPGGDAA